MLYDNAAKAAAEDALKIIEQYQSNRIGGVRYTSDSKVTLYKTTGGDKFANLGDAIEEQMIEFEVSKILYSFDPAIKRYERSGYAHIICRDKRKLIKNTIKELKEN